jgi:hypothetical protein
MNIALSSRHSLSPKVTVSVNYRVSWLHNIEKVAIKPYNKAI